ANPQQPRRGAEHDRHRDPGQRTAHGAARQCQVGRDQPAQRAAGVERGVQGGAPGSADPAHAFVQVRRLLVVGVVAVLFVRLALGHVIPPVTAAYLSPPPLRASLAMIQPAAKATPNEASGRSRIRSAALSTRSWPFTISWSTCSRAAPAPSSSAAMPDSALSARSALTCALPRRASSPATLAALRNASLAWPAACLRWSLASPRLLLRLSVCVGFIAGLRWWGGQFPGSWP